MCENLTPLGDIRRGHKRGPTDVQGRDSTDQFVVNLYTEVQFNIAPTPEANLQCEQAPWPRNSTMIPFPQIIRMLTVVATFIFY